MGNIKNAVNRIFWRFGGNGNKKPFPINEKDVEAYTDIKNYVIEKEKEQFKNNEAFAKMYIIFMMRIIEKENTTIYDTSIRKKIHKFLETPIDEVYQMFTDKLNESEQYGFLKDLDIDLTHPALVPQDQKTKDASKMMQAIKNPEQLERLTGEVWEVDFVKTALQSEVNAALNLF